jgi:hypothetical protein
VLHILFGAALIGHGLGHIMGFLAAWTRIPMAFTDAPWLFSKGVTVASKTGRIWGLLWLLVLATTVASGVAVMAFADWWRPLAVASAVASLVVIVPWWRAAKPARNAVLFDIVVLLALAPSWGATIAGTAR